MPKKCIICGEPAKFSIKNTNDFYCEECAKENFSDLELLERIEDRAKKLKEYVEDTSKLKAPQELEEVDK